MENQIEKTEETINPNGIIALVGAVLGAITAWLCTETFGGVILGLIGGLIFAVIYISVILPHKTHDR